MNDNNNIETKDGRKSTVTSSEIITYVFIIFGLFIGVIINLNK